MDIIGPIDNKKVPTFIITSIDRISRYIWTQGLKKTPTTKNMIEFFLIVTNITDTKLTRILTDRGTQFMSSAWLQHLTAIKAMRSLTSTYYPEGARITERANQTLFSKLRLLTNTSNHSANHNLKKGTDAINNLTKRGTKFLPSNLIKLYKNKNERDKFKITIQEIKENLNTYNLRVSD
jgi:hypothetical protein